MTNDRRLASRTAGQERDVKAQSIDHEAEGGNTMCPVCMTTAVLIAGSVASTGGLAAVAMKKFWMKEDRNG
jgi:hypothetical protein